jgi:4-hydroxybenzoate polyprenyltransferase
MMRRARSLFHLTRITYSLLICLGVALPIGLRSSDWSAALKYAGPVLLISMSAYLLNDLHDLERDLENHPDRPLPRNELTPRTAVIFFFCLLGVALGLIEGLFPDFAKFLFAVSIIAAMSYSYVVAHIPVLKNIYVASVALLPFLVIRQALGAAAPPLQLAVPLFFFVAGAEMLSDIKDRSGDGPTLANRLGPVVASIVAFGLKLIAACLLVVLALCGTHLIGAIVNLALEAGLIVLWMRGLQPALLLKATALQLAIAASFQLYPG